ERASRNNTSRSSLLIVVMSSSSFPCRVYRFEVLHALAWRFVLACTRHESEEEAIVNTGKPDRHSSMPAILFDLDGTLIDSVYQHVLAWREALEHSGTALSVWRIHRRIGMSGGLLVNALLRETGRQISSSDAENLQRW